MKKAQMFGNKEGFFKFVFVLLLITFLMYAAFQLGMPFYRYTALRTEAKEIARVSVSGDIERTRTQVFERAQKLKLPLAEKDIEVMKTTVGIRVKTVWSEEVDILGVYQKTFNFTIDVEE